MKKCILIIAMLALAGCTGKATRWESAGTLVSVSPWGEPVRSSGRLGAAVGDTDWGRSNVETTEGSYVVVGKISVAQAGEPVRVGYVEKDSSDEDRDAPSYLALGGQEYEIAR